MGTLTVGSLALALRLPGGAQDRAAAVQEVVERQFLPAVLDALACELDAVYGEAAIIRIRSLTIRLRIGPEMRNGDDFARQIGQDLAAHIHDMAHVAQPNVPPPPATAEVQIWPTAGAWRGAAVIAALRGERGPEGCTDNLPALAEKLLGEPADVVAATLVHCADAAVLGEVISALSPDVQHTLLARFASALPPAIRAVFLAVAERAGMRNPAPADKAEPGPTPDLPAHERPSDSAERTPTLDQEVPPPRRQVEHRAQNPAAWPDALRPPLRSSGPAVAARPPIARVPGVPAPDQSAAHQETPPVDLAPARRMSPVPDITPTLPPERNGAEAQPSSAGYDTQWGGLVYLVTLAFRLGMPEALWRIGVPEGSALSAMLATISGAPEDPLCAALAPGARLRPAEFPAVPDWARVEFCTTITAAARDLAGTDLGARIEPCRAALAEDGRWCLPKWGAAALVATLAEMIDRPLDARALTDLLGIAGEIEIGPRLILVRLPSDAVDFDIRRAGLDVNPGLLPWLDKRLEIEFGAAEEDWAG